MTARSWFRTLFARTPRTVRKAPTRSRPRLEALEDRLTPATFHVTTLADNGAAGSLRAAVAAANFTAGPDTIDFQVSGTIFLAGFELPITDSLSIVGPGAGSLTVSGSAGSRVFNVGNNLDVSLSGLTIAYGLALSGGGGILNAGRLTLTDVVVDHNAAFIGGGGILNTGQLTLNRTAVQNNVVLGINGGTGAFPGGTGGAGTVANGGGLATVGGSVRIAGSVFSNNIALGGFGGLGGDGRQSRGGYDRTGDGGAGGGGYGGGLYATGGAVVQVTNSTIRGNQARGGTGGAGRENLVTFLNYQAGYGGAGGVGQGGGAYASGGSFLTVTNSTVMDNVAAGGGGGVGGDSVGLDEDFGQFGTGGAGGGGSGGGLFTDGGTVNLTNATIVRNTGGGGNGGHGGYNRSQDPWHLSGVPGTRGAGFGGGVYGPATFTNATVYGNAVTTGAGFIIPPGQPLTSGSGTFGAGTVYNTIVALNTVDGVVGGDFVGNLAGGNNLIGSVIDPRLGPLGNNGGPTLTMAPLTGSPAINAGRNASIPADTFDRDGDGNTTEPDPFDQRGVARVVGDVVDIGAVEVQYQPPAVNRPPAVARTLVNVTVDEGSPATNTGTFDDPDGRGTVTLSASLGTLTKDDAAGTWNWSYTPPDGPDGPSTVIIIATDSDGQMASTTFSLTVNNVAPVIFGFLPIFFPPLEGSVFDGLGVIATDAAGPADPLTYAWTITRPDGTTFQATGNPPTLTLGDDGTYGFTVTVNDGDGGTDTRSGSFFVRNVAPTIAISGADSVNEGATYTLTLGAVTDPGTDTVSHYLVHWGDGTSNTYTTAGAKTHVYADGPATRDITIDLVDEDGTHTGRGNPLSVTVNNVAPTVAVSGATLVNQGATYTLTLGAVTDPGTDTVTQYRVNWGDGTSDTYTTAGAKTHVYATGAVTRAVTVDLTDEDGTFLDRGNALSVTVNAPPTVAVPAARTAFEDVDLAVDGISVDDPDGGSLTVTLAVGNGRLTLGTTAGLTVTGNGTGSVTLSGTVASLNAALATLLYRGNLNSFGSDTLSVGVADGGGLSTSGSVALTVKSAAEQAADLQAQVANLRASGVLNQGQANALIVKLNLEGNAGDAGKVQSFLDQVQDFLAAGLLTQAQADALLGPGNVLLLGVTRR